MALNNRQKQGLVKAAGKLAQALLKGAVRKHTPKSNNLGAPVPPPKQGCGACGPRNR